MLNLIWSVADVIMCVVAHDRDPIHDPVADHDHHHVHVTVTDDVHVHHVAIR